MRRLMRRTIKSTRTTAAAESDTARTSVRNCVSTFAFAAARLSAPTTSALSYSERESYAFAAARTVPLSESEILSGAGRASISSLSDFILRRIPSISALAAVSFSVYAAFPVCFAL